MKYYRTVAVLVNIQGENQAVKLVPEEKIKIMITIDRDGTLIYDLKRAVLLYRDKRGQEKYGFFPALPDKRRHRRSMVMRGDLNTRRLVQAE